MDVAFGQLDRFVQQSHAHRIRSDFSDLDVTPKSGQGLAMSASILERRGLRLLRASGASQVKSTLAI